MATTDRTTPEVSQMTRRRGNVVYMPCMALFMGGIIFRRTMTSGTNQQRSYLAPSTGIRRFTSNDRCFSAMAPCWDILPAGINHYHHRDFSVGQGSSQNLRHALMLGASAKSNQ
ncbi:uncharacterized protein BDCG_17154 [Blastomyces dermatitidis ER-3]|uniref:Uncharacterized protein n=2 Tax=Ajellomyces dermatitidis TaxID=5039 RepID=F2TRM5_AJEDA|nr:uncharacterized protein BDCG_17154 [Blastomyces dermatitidis ER-3]EEQ90503.2 hypothetical protein BDCG_17154 [Blastomyces dermatitidis ER-3]EGE85888.1 hypothetical protein BDDG_08833 [Blastomyces dermatitidis ATCC 18188]EQL34282.1 hypothetical protein BDFG_03810 [Blastomyces dermatitidis ATCC 26199]